MLMRGDKITGHLCAVGFRERRALGIDNLEHGIIVDTEFLPGKSPAVCPVGEAAEDFAKKREYRIRTGAGHDPRPGEHHVAVTSTRRYSRCRFRTGRYVKMLRAKDA